MSTEPAIRPGNDPWLSCERLVIGHRGRAILPPIDLQIRPGTVLAVLGRNGAGKSTFFKTLLGFLPAVKGHIRRSSPPPRLAYMAQAATLDSTVPVRARDVAAWGTLQGWGFMGLGRGRAMRETADRALSAANAAEI